MGQRGQLDKKLNPKEKLPFWQTVKLAWGPYKRLYSYVGPYKWRFILGLAFGILYGAVNSTLPLVIGYVWHSVSQGGAPKVRSLFFRNSEMLDRGPTINSIVFVCLAIPVVMILRSAFSYGNAYFVNWVASKVITDVRAQLFSKIIGMSMSFFNKSRSGFLMSRITNDTRMLQAALSNVSSDIFKQPIAIIGGVAVLMYLDWKFTIVTLVLFPVCIIPLMIYGRRARLAVKQEQEDIGMMSVTMQETFAGIRVVKAFAREEHQENTFQRRNALQFQNHMRIVKSTQSIGPLVEVVAAIGVGFAILYVYLSGLSTARFIALNAGIFLLYEPIKSLSRIHIVLQRSLIGATQIFNLLDSIPSVRDHPGAYALTTTKGRIEFEEVSFKYAKAPDFAVKDIQLTIEPGKTYALVGPSGAGKSTILSLILRLYDPASGTIRVDGRDLRSVTQKSLREQIGLVTQDTFLFHDKIFTNIQFGRLDATEEEVYAAARAAYAHEFILAQPKGYDTVVGDKGCLISGGQQQRLAIARAILKNAPILLLDEATSALDTESEKQIQLALQQLASGRTVIAIAHRLSTILSADQIVVMDGGRIKEVGNHRELMEKSGYYRRLYDLQFKHGHDETPQPGNVIEMLG